MSTLGLRYVSSKEPLINRLHRIQGQLRGIERMVEEERDCVDILTQVGAVSTALESLALQLLDDHVGDCVADAFASGDATVADGKSQELLEAVHRFTRRR